ncbi:MAG: hypothetical protein ACI8ZM_000621 [Crocinitomix sp.]|jgi:hypothetical protein
MRLIFIHFLLLLTIQTFAYELKPQYRNYGVDDGLPSSQVYEIIQDTKGYIWFGTDRGLVRYNGYEFKTFTVRDGLSINVIFHLDEGPDGTIYCYGKDRKVHLFKNNEFREFKYNDSLLLYHTHEANLLSFDCSPKGLVINSRDVSEKSITHISLSKSGEVIKNVADGIQILDNEFGVSIFGKNSGPIDQVSVNGQVIKFDKRLEVVTKFANIVKYQDILYFTIGGTLYQYNPQFPNEIKLIHEFNNGILDMKIDNSGSLYLGIRYTGLMKIPNGDIRRIECMISDVNISSILIDENDGLWASSLFQGLFYFENQESKNVEIANNAVIKEIESFGDNIYVLSSELKVYHLRTSNERAIELSFDSIMDFDWNTDSLITFIGFYTKMGAVVDLRKNSYYERPTLKGFVYTNGPGYDIVRGGFKTWNSKTQTYDHFEVDLFINCGMLDEQNRLILGADEGLKIGVEDRSKYSHSSVYSEVTNRSYNASTSDFKPDNKFFRNKIRDMKNIGDTLFVFGSAENGIYIQRKGKKDLLLKEEDGLISDAIDQVYFREGYLIAISKKGLSVINEEFGIVNYTRRNGLLSNEINDVIIRNDSLWTVTNNGTSLFPLKKKVSSTMPINFTACKVNEINQPIQKVYELKHENRSLEVSFEALSFIQEGEINYKYQLKGVDNNWVSTQNRTARYSNLPAGQFSFWLMVENADNSWTQPICLFEVSKPKPFWLTIYFIGFVLLLIIGLTGLFFRWRYRRIQRKERAKLQVLNLERKTLQAQMNPHFIFNSLTSLQNLIIKNDPDLANEYLGKFARLTRIALLQSTQNWVKLKDEITLLEHYIELEQIRFPDHFEYQIKINLQNPTIFVPPFLIQPFVENAILHGLAKKQVGGKIEITVEASKNQMIQFTIVDNGVGRSEANEVNKKRHKSLGIRLIKERLQLLLKMNAVEISDLYDDDENAIGTEVVLYVPYKKRLDESVND